MIEVAALSQVAAILETDLQGQDSAFSGISIDTRMLEVGDLYIAIEGRNFDGHEFVHKAAEKGASGAIVSKSVDSHLPQILVSDTVVALGKLANFNRKMSKARVVGITGSQGKTSVKEMIGQILNRVASTLVTKGNLNNEIGVPLTLLELNENHEFAVIEMGANHAGEIDYSVKLVEPDIAVITNAYRAHLEGFGSLQGVAEAKGEIINGLNRSGVLVLNADDRFYGFWIQRAGDKKVVSFSIKNSAADYIASEARQLNSGEISFRLSSNDKNTEIRLALLGMHNVANAVAAAATAVSAGARLHQVVEGLQEMSAVRGRMSTHRGINGCLLIDDSYNASPDSFQAAIQTLAGFEGKRVLIMGDMAELGSEAESAHQEIGASALEAGIDELWTVGEQSKASAKAFGTAALSFDNKTEIIEKCKVTMKQGTTCLIKGSRSSAMDKIVNALIAS